VRDILISQGRWAIHRTSGLLLVCLLCFHGDRLLAQGDPFASAVRPTAALSPEEELLALRVPAGFRIQLFASEPEILKPINMAFDERGRLWVSCTQDYPYVNLDEPGDSIRILEDTDGDGQADRVTTFVDGITHPMGLLPYKDGVIAFSIPNIMFFRDTDGDGKCDERKVLYGPFDYSKDTHGLNNGFRRGFDGWVYACHGFNNHSVVTGPDGHVLDIKSGSLYRFRPDGTRIERYTHGQVNPFGMTFDLQGDLYSSDCHTKPLMLMFREGQYPDFWRQHDGLGFAPEILKHSHGSTAIAGVMQASDERIPDAYRNNFFLGNVMTSRVNRDSQKPVGSSFSAVERPDLVTSDDPWFRPVDLQQGPDGAIYVADFYNRIIGHYEVALDHPGRDRTRGRIWRIVPVSADGQPLPGLNQVRDLTQCNVSDLVGEANTTNVPRLIKVIDELSDRRQSAAIPELQGFVDHPHASDSAQVAVLWSLQRMSLLPTEPLQRDATSPSLLTRIHVQRLLSDRPGWNTVERQLAISRLNDESPIVRRAAAEALARHPQSRSALPLLKTLQSTPVEDAVLHYQLLLALRNQLRPAGTLPTLLTAHTELTPPELTLLARAALGLEQQDAATGLLSILSRSPAVVESVHPVSLAEKIARWGTPQELTELTHWIRTHWAGNLNTQVQLLHAVRDGLRKQGIEQDRSLSDWGAELAGHILHDRPASSGWTVTRQRPDRPAGRWDYEWRTTPDGQNVRMFSSLQGGEQSVSVLRSPPFEVPAELSFLLCGHIGFPDLAVRPVNFVRLCRVEDGQELARQLPPRRDQTVQVLWNLKEHQGEKAVLEVVDGLDLGAYAWLAIGGLDPAILPLPSGEMKPGDESQEEAIQLIRDFDLRPFSEDLERLADDRSLGQEVRFAALETLARWSRSPLSPTLAVLWNLESSNPSERQEIRQQIQQGTEDSQRQQIATLAKPRPSREQILIAQSLLTRPGGEALLLDLCDAGNISPRVLMSSSIRPQLEQSPSADIRERAQRWIGSLPSASDDVDRLIASLFQRSLQQPADSAQGRKVFEDRCAACHQIGGAGKVIGPQLDGVGSRGAERLLEDILAPNRNVDEAFRSRTYALSDGRVLSGMFRRQDGALIVLADQKGEEQTFRADDVDQEAISPVSIMPDNWRDLIPEQELLNLLAYLAEQRKS